MAEMAAKAVKVVMAACHSDSISNGGSKSIGGGDLVSNGQQQWGTVMTGIEVMAVKASTEQRHQQSKGIDSRNSSDRIR